MFADFLNHVLTVCPKPNVSHEWGNVNLTLNLKVQLGVSINSPSYMKRLQSLCFAEP